MMLEFKIFFNSELREFGFACVNSAVGRRVTLDSYFARSSDDAKRSNEQDRK